MTTTAQQKPPDAVTREPSARLRSVSRVIEPLALPALLFVVLLILVGMTQTDVFLTRFNITNVLIQVTPLVVIAVGQTFVVASGGLDLSVGSIVSLVAVSAAVLFDPLGAPLAITIALLVGLAVGLVNGLAVAAGLESFLVTLATLSLAQGVAFAVRPVPGGSVPRWFGEIASTWGPLPIALPLAVMVAALATFIFGRTRTGAHILAVGGDAEIARLSGVRVRAVLVRAYLLSALCASLAALFLLARVRTGDPLIGGALTLNSLAAVVLGGTLLGGGRATLAGTVLGAAALGILANLLNLTGVSSFYQAPITGLLIIFAVLAPAIASRILSRRRRKAMITGA